MRQPVLVNVYRLSPLEDPRWDRLVARHPFASVFHTTGWLRAVRLTYGYEPVALTTSSPGDELQDALVYCGVRSWITGRRIVSLPFADHCDPLVEHVEPLMNLCSAIERERWAAGWKYVELRSSRFGSVLPALTPSDEYCHHVLDLRPSSADLFKSLHRDSVQRKIQRAAREHLVYDEGRDEHELRCFYRLLVGTRRRHGVPTQPFSWFRNLAAELKDALLVRIVHHRRQPVAAILTLRHDQTMVYKYGASDPEWHRSGCMQFLFWHTIETSRSAGCLWFDLGRTSPSNEGLLTFKDRLGATRSVLTYRRSPSPRPGPHRVRDWLARCGAEAVRRAPRPFGVAAGRLLYRHAG
jgi:CelD/BcsL family acetyltransferase involved in cellulose biosynthesis